MNPSMHRRRALAIVAATLACAAAGTASAQAPAYPAKAITFIVPFAAGSATDQLARALGQSITTDTKQPVVVDNKAGASGGIGTEFVARAKPDGYTLLLGTQTALAVNPSLVKKLGYNVEKDFAPVTYLASTPLVLLASKKSGAADANALFAAIKARPDAISYGTSGNATSQHLTTLLLLNRLGAKAVHVPYRGSSQSLTDLAGNQIDMQFDNMTTALAFAKNGQARALAVTSLARTPLQPDLPTVAELGLPGFEAVTWLGLLAPAGTPGEVVGFLNREVTAVLDSAAVKAKLAAQGFTPRPMQPEAFARFIKDETVKFADLIKANNIVVE